MALVHDFLYPLVTLWSVVNSGRYSKSSNPLWLFLLPTRMKKIHSKIKALEWSKHFSHCKSVGIFSDAQGQLTPLSDVRSGRHSNS